MDQSVRKVADRLAEIAVFGLALVLFVSSLDLRSSGDTIYYANIIDNSRYDVLTLHQGYYLIGKLFALVLSGLVGLSTDQALAVMSAVFAAAALIVAFKLLQRYLDSSRDSAIGVLVLALSYRYFINGTTAEIYVVQSFFLWTAVLMFEGRRFRLSGVFVALAMWVTPLTAFYLLWFPAVAWIRSFGVRALLRTGAMAATLYLPFLVAYHHELLWGERGLLVIDDIKEASLITALSLFVFYQFKSFTFLTLLYVPAAFNLRKHRPMLWVMLAAALPNLYVLSNLSFEDNVFILALDLFFVFWMMVGWRYLRDRSLAWVPAVLLAFQAFLLLYPERMVFRIANGAYGAELREVGRVMHQHEHPVLFADWSERAAFVYFNAAEKSFPLDAGCWYEMTVDTQRLQGVSPQRFAANDAIYVLEYWRPSPRSRFFQSEAALVLLRETESDVRQVERLLSTTCVRVPDVRLPLYRCR